MKRPEELLSEVLSWADTGIPDLPTAADLAPLRALAATMGGDVAIALDGPVLPVPSFKVAIEVYDPARFQTFSRSFEDILLDFSKNRADGDDLLGRALDGDSHGTHLRSDGADDPRKP